MLGPEAFDAVPFLDLLAAPKPEGYGSPVGHRGPLTAWLTATCTPRRPGIRPRAGTTRNDHGHDPEVTHRLGPHPAAHRRRWREASGGRALRRDDPASGATLTRCADGTPEDGLAALEAAHEAQAGWAATPPRDRSEILRSAFEALTARADEFAMLMTLEMGKTVAEARGEVTYGAEFFRWFAEEAVRIHGRYSVAPNGATRLLTMKQPVGPTLMITPWNFPLAMGTRKIGPAIAAGCTMVVKPAHETPLTMLLLAQVLQESGLPDGVLNVVTTTHSGAVCEPLIRDARLRKLTFTGSTAVGKMLVEQSAEQLLRVSMELGGNAPFLVFEDADVDAAVDGAMLAKMRNIGEACTAANRFFVHESLAEEFSTKLAARMGALVVGKGTKKGVDVGPLITAEGPRRGRRARRGCRGQGRHGAHRRWPGPRPGVLLRADRPRRRPRRQPLLRRGDLRPGGAGRAPSPTRPMPSRRPTAPSTASSATSTRTTRAG